MSCTVVRGGLGVLKLKKSISGVINVLSVWYRSWGLLQLAMYSMCSPRHPAFKRFFICFYTVSFYKSSTFVTLYKTLCCCKSLVCRFLTISMLLSLFDIGGISLCMSMKEILESHSQHFTHLWEGFMGNKQKPRLDQMKAMQHFSVICLYFNTPNLFYFVVTFHICQVCLRWSSCCADAVPLFT